MKLYKFEEFKNSDILLEKAGFPESLQMYYNIIFNTLNEKYTKYLNRKGYFANYSETINLDWYDIEDEINSEFFKDCPIEKIELHFKITHSKNYYDNYGGLGYFIKNYKPNGTSYRFNSLSGITKIAYKIRIDLALNIGGEIIEIEKFRTWLKTMVRHELIHIYQFIKSKQHKIPSHECPIVSASNFIINNIDTPNLLNNLFFYIYVLSKAEIDPYIAGDIVDDRSLQKREKVFLSIWNYKKFVEEINDFNDEDMNFDIILKIFKREYKYYCRYDKQPINNKILNLNTVEEFYDYFHKDLTKKWEYYKRGVQKYSYMLKSE